MIIFLLILWNLVLSFIVAHYAQKREITYLGAFLVSLFFSPIIGFVCVSLSNKIDDKYLPNKNYIKLLNVILYTVLVLLCTAILFILFPPHKEQRTIDYEVERIVNLQDSSCIDTVVQNGK